MDSAPPPPPLRQSHYPLDDEKIRRLIEAAEAPPDKNASTRGAVTAEDAFRPGQLRRFVERMKQEFGEDAELVKQALADLRALERQTLRSHFEARQEYVRQHADADREREKAIREYGLQTLKWMFLLNAGAIALIVAYVGGAAGKAPNSQLSTFGPLLKALWPFVVGCILVTLSGATGFLNFSYATASAPSTEALHGFLDPNSKSWPIAKFQNMGETTSSFYQRYSYKIGVSRKIAIGFGLASCGLFAYGVYRVIHAVLI
jgi:hypothetical protein